jgi:prepilin-type N-terminal cleavage/methylation domain-containing protein
MKRYRQTGLTLMELMIVLSIIAVLAAMALPSFNSSLERRRLIGAAENLFADLQFARAESIKQNATIQVQFDTAAWCYGLDDTGADCDCADTPANCTINGQQKVVLGTEYQNVGLSMTLPDSDIIISPRQGMPVDSTNDVGTFTFSLNGQSKAVSMNLVGRVKMD